ncbi:hypothetical protein DEU35_1451 [Microbacterium sp. AG157]|nr:hypothetical protein DEU35_1451 [Microbacterium sp. AG157]
MIGSLAWPVVLFIVVLLLLGPIRRLIGRIRTWKGFGVEAELAEDLQVARRQAREAVGEALTDSARGDGDEAPPAAEGQGEPSAQENTVEGTEQRARTEGVWPQSLRELYDIDGASPADADKWNGHFAPPKSGKFPSVARTVAAPEVGIRESFETLGGLIGEVSALQRKGRVGPPDMPTILGELFRAGRVRGSFVRGVMKLWKVRNDVLVGEASPGPDEALDFRNSAMQLFVVALKLRDELIEEG